MIGALSLMGFFSRPFQFLPGTPRDIMCSSKSQPAPNRVQNTGNKECRNRLFSASQAQFCWSPASRLAKATATAARPCRPTRSAPQAVLWLGRWSPKPLTATSQPAPLSAQPAAHFAMTLASASAATDKTSPVRGRAQTAAAPRTSENWKCPRNSSSSLASGLPALPAAPKASTPRTWTARLSAQASVRPLPIWAGIAWSKARPLAAQPVRCATTFAFANNDLHLASTARVSASSPNEFRRLGIAPGRLFHVRPLPQRPLPLRKA